MAKKYRLTHRKFGRVEIVSADEMRKINAHGMGHKYQIEAIEEAPEPKEVKEAKKAKPKSKEDNGNNS